MDTAITTPRNPDVKLFFIVAGEDSGDLHGARLVEEIRQQESNARFVGHGGNKMAAAGVEIFEPADKLAVMGFTEVVKHLAYFKKVMRTTVETIERLCPTRIILIDYPGFNLRLARNIFHLGIPVTYFILPQVWAWKEKRVKIIRKYFDQVLSIFPFEEEWYHKRKVAAQFIGHPFAEQSAAALTQDEFYQKHGLSADEKLLVLFPGSRQQEVDRHWPVFLPAARKITQSSNSIRIIVGKAPHVELNPLPDDILVESDDPRLALRYGQAALVASGTATLEAAVYDIPAVVAYRLSAPTYFLARSMVRLPYVAMVNLIAGKQVVPELLQNKLTVENLKQVVTPLLNDTNERETLLSGYAEVRQNLGAPGAYRRAAEAILAETQ